MTTYTAIADTDIDADSPGTAALFTLLRDNPIAITEGAAGAPKIQLAAMDTDSVDTAQIVAAAIGNAELDADCIDADNVNWITSSTESNQSIDTTYTLPEGIYLYIKVGGLSGSRKIEANVNGTWTTVVDFSTSLLAMGPFVSDGSNLRINDAAGGATTYYWKRVF